MRRRSLDCKVTPLRTWLAQRGASPDAVAAFSRFADPRPHGAPGSRGLSIPLAAPLIGGAALATLTRPTPIDRRGFLSASAGLAVVGALSPSLGGCDEKTLAALFEAISVIKAAFTLAEAIGGGAVFKMPEGKDQTIELLLDLLGATDPNTNTRPTVDAGVVTPTVPGDGESHVVEYSGLEAAEPGEHQVKGEAVKTERKTLPFTVT